MMRTHGMSGALPCASEAVIKRACDGGAVAKVARQDREKALMKGVNSSLSSTDFSETNGKAVIDRHNLTARDGFAVYANINRVSGAAIKGDHIALCKF